jgi:hypothetical protein
MLYLGGNLGNLGEILWRLKVRKSSRTDKRINPELRVVVSDIYCVTFIMDIRNIGFLPLN